jgi:hypothetical protein
MQSQIISSFSIGDLIKHEFITYEQKKKLETGVIIELFKNAGHQEFAEILWNDGSLTTLDLKSIEKVEIEDNI